MTDSPKAKRTPHDRAKLIIKMMKEAKRVENSVGAKACIVICLFDEPDGQVSVQDAGKFPMPPDKFYNIILQAHEHGLLGEQKKKSKIIRAN